MKNKVLIKYKKTTAVSHTDIFKKVTIFATITFIRKKHRNEKKDVRHNCDIFDCISINIP